MNFSTKYQRWYLVEKSLILKQWSTKNQLLNHNSTKNQPNFNHFSTLTFQLQTCLIFGWIVVEKLIFGWSLFQNQQFLNQISTLRKVEALHRTFYAWTLVFKHRMTPHVLDKAFECQKFTASIMWQLHEGMFFSFRKRLCWSSSDTYVI